MKKSRPERETITAAGLDGLAGGALLAQRDG
jgi:hypothetical protein